MNITYNWLTKYFTYSSCFRIPHSAYTWFWTKYPDEMQRVLLNVLVAKGIIRSNHFWLDAEHVEEAIQNVLICVEMVFFAVLHQYAYHVAPYSGDIEAKLKLQNKHEWWWLHSWCGEVRKCSFYEKIISFSVVRRSCNFLRFCLFCTAQFWVYF